MPIKSRYIHDIISPNLKLLQLIFIFESVVQLIVSGMTGSSVIALSRVQEETEQIPEQKKP